ncbi:transcriptional regulator, IclR family [Salinihabitans flavidus]|uniref:Transcriptional regulator, IclR family n=1 Tax=Salinihabitans flavidus TaxID=569882 RepID=A0A1H8MKU4_9RHOB|nr:HTH-type transcriptional regulator BhcR [Salinihabitans flavidus]SEO18005.1 transcriptional regulator, IclR family [Salinihabitans flavidus]
MPPKLRQRGRPKAFHDQTEKTRIQSLDRALDVLEALAAQGGQTLTEIAEDLGQSPATIYRILTTLEVRGMAEADPGDQTWHVGPGAFRLGSAFLRRASVVERARPVMRSLMESTGETANLAIEKGGKILFLSQVETHETIRAFSPPGTQSPLHASGIGKALLAFADPARIDGFLRDTLEAFTPKTITDPAAMRADLDRIRVCGYSFDDEERTEGMRCIAAPILNFYGEAVAGISVSGPTHRMREDRIEHLGALISRAAADLSRALGAP